MGTAPEAGRLGYFAPPSVSASAPEAGRLGYFAPQAVLLFGDNTGANKTGSFAIAEDNALLSNPLGVTEMTTSSLSAQGVWAEGGQTLTVTGTEVADPERDVRVKDWKTGQFALHAHANAANADPTLVFSGNKVAYIDIAARLDGDAARPTERPANRIVMDDVEASSKIRKFAVPRSGGCEDVP